MPSTRLLRPSAFLNLLSIMAFTTSGSMVVYPRSRCSLELARTIAPLVPGTARGETPLSVIWNLLYSPGPSHSSFSMSAPLSMPTRPGSKGSVDLWLSIRYLSVRMIAGIWKASARLKASIVR